MSGPDFGVLIIRASLLGAGIILLASGTDPIQRWIGVVLIAWTAASTAAGPLRRALIRWRQRSAQRRGDIWMSEAARAQTASHRAWCQRQAHDAYAAASHRDAAP